MALSIIIITQDDPFYVPIFYERFFSILDTEKVNIDSIIVLEPLGKKSLFKLARQMWGFYGPKDFFRMSLRFLNRKFLSKLYDMRLVSNAPTLKRYAQSKGVAVRTVENINDDSFVNELKKKNLDLVVSVAASQIFKKGVLGAARFGCINLHSGKLPRYRGMLPCFWQLLNKEPVAGVTVHCMNSKIDDGDIIMQRDVPINTSESLETLIIKTKRVAAELLVESLYRFCEGDIHYLPNDREKATYFTFPSPEDVRRFRDQGLRLL